ncbi:MAG: NADH kinase [Euryarchaeota archaeon]|nr:NADH kinase [Euryarchaeota archaeon]
MDFGIVARPDLAQARRTARQAWDFLRTCRKVRRVVVEERLARHLRTEGVPLDRMNVDVIVSIGGDGTVLKALQEAHGRVFAINAGVLGFLTEVPLEDAIPGLRRVVDGRCIIEKRLRLKTVIRGRRLFDSTNEAVIHTATTSKMRHYRILLSGQQVDDVRADGIIVATPTGSTCYAMSAGGPIVDPGTRAFVIVPLAPFKMSSRAVVVPSNRRLTVCLVDDKPSKLVLDGQVEEALPPGTAVEFSASERPAEFIRFRSDFYENLRLKLLVDPCVMR